MTCGIGPFERVILADTEFTAVPGERPKPVCMVWKYWGESEAHRLWLDGDLPPLPGPFADDQTLFVAFFSSAEFSVLLELGWPLPRHVLDLYVEFRALTNGRELHGNGLLAALAFFGLKGMETVEKDAMRDLAIRGGPFTPDERIALLDYCEEDVVALDRLLERMAPLVDLPRALLRGRYLKAVARMERTGVPVDAGLVRRLRDHWEDVKRGLIDVVDDCYGVFDSTTFRATRWVDWSHRNGIRWPLLESGAPSLDDETFRVMALAHPAVRPMHELRKILGQLRQLGLAVGSDGRNRCLLSPFRTKTGRNAPSNSAFVFGAPGWLRGCIQPPPGRALAYLDWAQEEFAIAGVLSGDEAMIAAYESGDPYLAFAVRAGIAPASATKASHRDVRERCKACVLGVQYEMTEIGLALRIGQSTAHARELLEAHRQAYPQYWRWSQTVRDVAYLESKIRTVFGWPLHITPKTKVRTVSNFLMQATGGELLRLAASLATERGLEVCAPIHDAFLIEAAEDQIEDAVTQMQRAMTEASRVVLNGFELRSDARIVRHPDRLIDEKGLPMWERVMSTLAIAEGTTPIEESPHA